MSKVTTSPAVVELQEKWKAAKEAEAQWVAYRRNLEEQILDSLKNMGIVVPVSGSIKLELTNITFSVERKFDDAMLAELAAAHPHMVGSTMRVEYKMAITKPKVDALVAGGTEIGQELSKCFEDKPRKPSFSAQ